jgi:hypothetical protein
VFRFDHARETSNDTRAQQIVEDAVAEAHEDQNGLVRNAEKQRIDDLEGRLQIDLCAIQPA